MSRSVGLFAALVLVVLAGCGSEARSPGAPSDQPVLEPKIREYVGDGGGSLKSWPAFIPLAAVDRPARVGYPLDDGDAPKYNQVRKKRVSWYEVQNLTSREVIVVTQQPVIGEDADLYVIDGNGNNYGGNAVCLGFSKRSPSEPSASSEASGFSPDWVAFEKAATGGWPAAQVAVYGLDTGAALKQYRIDVDFAEQLTVNASSIDRTLNYHYGSHWYYFGATSGTQYTVYVTTAAGDPDHFVYQDVSTEFVDSDTSGGGGWVTFTAAETGRHYVRVYGYSGPFPIDYQVCVTSP